MIKSIPIVLFILSEQQWLFFIFNIFIMEQENDVHKHTQKSFKNNFKEHSLLQLLAKF